MPISKALSDILSQIKSRGCDSSLDLSGIELDNEGALALADALSENKNIQELDLSYNEIGSDGCKALANLNIKNLNLSGNFIADGATFFLENTHIEVLALNDCKITDSIAKRIFQNKHLKTLCLAKNGLTDDAISNIPADMAMELMETVKMC